MKTCDGKLVCPSCEMPYSLWRHLLNIFAWRICPHRTYAYDGTPFRCPKFEGHFGGCYGVCDE